MPVRLSVFPVRASNSKTKKKEIKIGTHIPHGTGKLSVNFYLKNSKVKVTGRQKPQEISAVVYLRVADQVRAAQAPTAN